LHTRILALERAKRGWTFRGRPRGRLRSYADTRRLECLAAISASHGIDPKEFFDKLVEAWEQQESKCKKLTIACRIRTRKASVFLITTDYEVVAQLSIPTHLLNETDPLKEFGYVLENAKLSLVEDGKGCRPNSTAENAR
jgi:hypothetical protein